jgi:hypothetical protein
MKSASAAVLLAVGNDAVLLQTRVAVLRTAGFHVIVAQTGDQAKVAARYFAFQAVLLCHSLGTQAQDALAIDLGCCSKRELPILKLQQHECQPASLIVSVRTLVDKYRTTDPSHKTAHYYHLAEVQRLESWRLATSR